MGNAGLTITPENYANCRLPETKKPKTGLKLKIKLNGNVVAARAATPQTPIRQADILARVIPAGRQGVHLDRNCK